MGRSYRFVPKRVVRESILYVLAAVSEKYSERLDLHEVLFMSNHMHLVCTDREGCLPAFMQELNSLVSRQLNAIRGTTGTNIEAGYSFVAVEDDEALLRHIVYTLANPCSAHIVARVHQWKGVNTSRLEYGIPKDVTRPKRGLWATGCRVHKRDKAVESKRARYGGRTRMPKVAHLVLVRPQVRPDLTDAELRQLVRARLTAREDQLIRERRRPVMGMHRAERLDYLAVPGREELFGLRPTFSSASPESRVAAARGRREFIDRYRDALMKFVAGVRDVEFPLGTWLMVRRFRVCTPVTG